MLRYLSDVSKRFLKRSRINRRPLNTKTIQLRYLGIGLPVMRGLQSLPPHNRHR
jgi:hypothetical protein